MAPARVGELVDEHVLGAQFEDAEMALSIGVRACVYHAYGFDAFDAKRSMRVWHGLSLM